MPFQKIYEIEFSSQHQANPILNTFNWPALQITPNSAEAEHQWKQAGLDLKITRNPGATSEVRNCVYVVPPGGLPMNSRLLMKLKFLHPNASGPSGHSNLYPEPWGIVLCFSSVTNVSELNNQAIVSCQFHRNGVRLNTPFALQTKDPDFLESPLDYSQYNPVPPHPIHNPAVVPTFTLVHSFSGNDLSTNHHTPGAGYLKISRVNSNDSIDNRVYSHADIASGNSSPRIHAMGIVLATLRGSGTMSVRLLTFEIWRDTASDPL